VIMTNGKAISKSFFGKKEYGNRNKTFYAPVDLTLFNPNSNDRISARKILQIPKESIVCGTIGNRVHQKNHELLMEVAALTQHLYPSLRYLILGSPNAAYNQQYSAGVINSAEKLNEKLPGYITIMDPGRRVPFFLNSFDIFSLTSHAEGVPIALFEASCMKLPTVCTDVGSISDVIQHSISGYLTKKGDVQKLAFYIIKLFESSALRNSVGTAAYERISQDFSIEQVVQIHLEAYEQAIMKN